MSLRKSIFSARISFSQRQPFRVFIKPLDHSIQYQSFKWNARELHIFNANKNAYENQFEFRVYAQFWSPTFLETIRWFKVVFFSLFFAMDFLFFSICMPILIRAKRQEELTCLLEIVWLFLLAIAAGWEKLESRSKRLEKCCDGMANILYSLWRLWLFSTRCSCCLPITFR